MYKIKQLPEDFFVKEVSNVKIKSTGRYSYFLLRKKDLTTEEAAQKIADFFRIPRKRFGYAGNKDRRAITEQICSILGKIKNVKLKNLEIKILGYGDKPISLGDLNGNEFVITVRNLGNNEKPKKISKIINYFDKQRFSSNNALIGKEIIKNNFKKAIELISEEEKKAEEIREYLNKNREDYIGAIRKMPRKILQMYVHSFQSKLWNETAGKFEKSSKNIKIPIIGFGTELKDDKIGELIGKILEKEEINLRNFVIKAMPELSSEGGERDLLAKIKNLKIGKLETDELNKGKKKCMISFKLPKGSYATLVVKALFS